MSTHTQRAATTVRSSIVVAAPIDRAFRVFTEDFGAFKPALATKRAAHEPARGRPESVAGSGKRFRSSAGCNTSQLGAAQSQGR